MISRYNSTQCLQAILCVLGGSICYFLAYLFFRHLPVFAASRFGFSWSPLISIAIVVVALMLVSWSGYRIWKKRGGLYSYHESSLYHDLGEDTAGAVVVDQYAHRITGPAYVIGQIFLAGPLLLLRAWTLIKSLIPNDPALEKQLNETLKILRSANKWQSIDDYPVRKTEILYLAQMSLIDFSAHKGSPRIKADKSNGV